MTNWTWIRLVSKDSADVLAKVSAEAGKSCDPLVLAEDVKNVVAELNEVLYDVVREARSQGRTWREIGDALSITPQGAQQRFYGLPGQSSTIRSEASL